MYDVNSFVAKNCRCCLAFIPIRDSQGKPVPFSLTNPQGTTGDAFLQLAQQASTTVISTAIIQALISQIEEPEEVEQ